MAKPADYVVDNDTGANVRTDLNNLFEAIRQNNGYGSEPTQKYKYMWYADVGTGKMSFYKANASQKIDFISLTDGNFFGPNGSASNPSYTFTNSPSTGLFTSTTNNIDIATNGTNRFRIAANGGVFLGRGMAQDPVSATGNVGSGVKFVATANTEYDSFGLVVNAKDIVGIFNRTQTTGTILEFKYNGSTIVGGVSTNGSTTNYNQSSDYRLKQDINNIDDAITKIKTLRPITFRWKNNVDIGYENGFIAHEVQETGHYNQLVNGVKDGTDYQGLDYSKFTPMLVAALQEAVAKIETLEAKVAALEAK